MKRLIAAVLVLAGMLLSGHHAFSADIKPESVISEVTVFPDSAIVSRVANIELTTGDHKILFTDIIPEIKDGSVRAYASGSAEYKLYGAQVEKQYLEDVGAENVKKLKDEIQKTEDDMKMQDYVSATLTAERDFLASISLYSKDQMPKELLTKIPQVTELDGIIKFLDTKYKDNYTQVIETEKRSRDLNKKLEAMRAELDQIEGSARKTKSSIVVTLKVMKPGTLDLKVSYGVGGASWQPIYDARADLDANRIEFVSYAVVKQTTGEEWSGVDVTLSTAKPDVSGRLPEITPWLLRPYIPPRPVVVADSFVSKRAMAKAAPEVLSANLMREDRWAAAPAPMKEVYAASKETGIAVSYLLPQKVAIKSDGTDHRFPVSTQSLAAEFKYWAYPRVTNSAYLGSNVTNAKDLQLLPGSVNIFFQGDFVGTSSIDAIAPGEKFDLYLGADENVKVKRELVEKKVDDVWIANIPAPNRKTVYKYKITAENYKSKKIAMNLFDSMPVSEDEKIKVKIENISLEPTEKDWKAKKGVWRWDMDLDPKEKKEITYTFSVEHPRDLIVEGL